MMMQEKPALNDRTSRLCYIKGPWAYFTTMPIAEQWGDDWNDAPYEHNAGTPYVEEGHEITILAFDGAFEEPCDAHYNTPWSVQDINGGACPWLRSERAAINAGATVAEFVDFINTGGGAVYAPMPEATP